MMIFPQPQRMDILEGEVLIEIDPCDDLVSLFRKVRSGVEGIRTVYVPSLEKEAYRMTVNEDGVLLEASCDEGLFRAVTSLRQILRGGGHVPYLFLEDRPALARRGYMLDISRGKKPKVATLKTMIDFLASLKYNEFQLYMEGDCFQYATYPEENADGACLTAEDIRELDRYCRERFIDLVANQNSFGHMYTWLSKPAFHHLGLFEGDETPSTLNPLLPESFAFICNLYASLLPCFSSEYVNIGLDEAYGLGRYQMEAYCREKGKDVAFMEWLNKLSDHIRDTYGKKVMFWADMIHHAPELYPMIPRDAIALEWGYELIQSQRMTAHCIA